MNFGFDADVWDEEFEEREGDEDVRADFAVNVFSVGGRGGFESDPDAVHIYK